MASLSRTLALWVAKLRYEDLPPAVVDRAKGVTLHAIASALVGSTTRAGQQAVKLVTEEEAGVANGATIMVSGAKVTRGGAGFANSEMMLAGGKFDTFRMLTHPGTSILPAALAAAESSGASGREFITAIAAGYEVSNRMSAEFIPTVMARGFHAGPDRGVKQAPFVVLVGAYMPAILVETAFVSNASEARLLSSSGFQDRIAMALAGAIEEFFDTHAYLSVGEEP